MASVFVGESRKALVKGIVDKLDNLTDFRGDSRACLISLEAPSGWGKTRVIQEVYKLIAERQSSPYWPHSIIPENEDDPVSRRKHLVPSFDGVARDRNVLPEFFWWGLTCDMRSTNMLSRTLMEDIEQLRFHAPYLEASWAASKLTGLGKYATITKAKSALGALFEEGATTGLAKLAELGLGATPFGIGLGLKLVTGGIKAAKDRKEELTQMALGSEAHKAADEDLIDETVNLFARLAHKDLPIIICVEDIHKATSPVLELLAKLVARNAPILILTTTWPGEFEKIDELNALLDTSWGEDRILRMIYDQPAPKGLPKDASLAQLSSEDLGEIIRARYPKAEAETKALLAQRYRNPLPLELVLNMKSLKRDHPYLELDVEDIEELPETVRDLYNSLWNELPEPVQQLLAISTELMPENQPKWLMSLLIEATRQMADEEWAREISQIAANDKVPHGWARVVENWFRRFGESDQMDIARLHVKELFGKRQLRKFNEIIAQKIDIFDFEHADEYDAEATYKAWFSMALYKADKISLDTYLSAGFYLIKTIGGYYWSDESEEKFNFGRLLVNSCLNIHKSDEQQILILKIQYECSEAITNFGYMDRYAGFLRNVLKNNIATINESNLEFSKIFDCFSKKIRQDYIGFNAKYYDENAVKQYYQLLKDLVKQTIRVHGQHHLEVFKVREEIIDYQKYTKMISINQWIESRYKLLDEKVKFMGPDNHQILSDRRMIISGSREVKSTDQLLSDFEDLLIDQRRVIGEESSLTLITRMNMADLMYEAGRISDTLEAYKNLYEDYCQILGPTNVITLEKNNFIGDLLFETENFSAALDIYQELVMKGNNILSAETVFEVRRKICVALAITGCTSEALDQIKSLIFDQTNYTFTSESALFATHRDLAIILAQSGKISEAQNELKLLLKKHANPSYNEHVDLFVVRSIIASSLVESQNLTEALNMFKELLRDQSKTLGKEHVETLTTRNNIGYLLANTEAFSEALDADEQLVKDQTRILGVDHPDTIITMHRIKKCENKLYSEPNN